MPRTRPGVLERDAQRREAALGEPDEDRLRHARVVEDADEVAGEVPVGERLPVGLGQAEAPGVDGEAPVRRAQLLDLGANISWSMKNPCEKTTTGPSPPESE